MSYRLLKFVLEELEQFKQEKKVNWSSQFTNDVEALEATLKKLLPYF